MNNWSLKAKILIILVSLFGVSVVGYSFSQFNATAFLARQAAMEEAQRFIDRTNAMFMVTTGKFQEDFSKARAMGSIEAQLVLEDYCRMKTSLAAAVTEDFGADVARVRLVGDADIFGIEPLGKKESAGIAIGFEREAALAIAGGAPSYSREENGFMRIAVPQPSRMHRGCAGCHLSLRRGMDSDQETDIVLGTLNVYVPFAKALAKERAKARQLVYGVVLVLLFASLALYVFTRRAITGPLGRAAAFTDKVSCGDLSETLAVRQQDEIGLLSGAMNRMVANMRQLALAAEKIANGDLTVQVAALSDRDMLGHALKRMVENLSGIIAEILLSARRVLAGAEQLSDASQAMSQGATEQASSLEQISSSMNEIAAQARHNSESATQARMLAAESKGFAENGDRQVQAMVAAMQDISAASSNVSRIIKIIDEIAFQTNLLALNAAVEAARAGRHGRGFAVVAEEVRSLAARSANAAKETEEMIAGAMRKIQEGSSLAGSTAEALRQIVDAAVKMTDLIADIAAASNEQAQGVAQITAGLGHVDQVTQHNTAHAEQSATAAQDLSGQARAMQQLVSAFRLRAAADDTSEHARGQQQPGSPMLGAGHETAGPSAASREKGRGV